MMQYIRLVTATVNDPMIAAANSVILRNTLRDGSFSGGMSVTSAP
jgi:hypothetical protein